MRGGSAAHGLIRAHAPLLEHIVSNDKTYEKSVHLLAMKLGEFECVVPLGDLGEQHMQIPTRAKNRTENND